MPTFDAANSNKRIGRPTLGGAADETVMLGIKLPRSLRDDVRRAAAADGMSMSEYLRGVREKEKTRKD